MKNYNWYLLILTFLVGVFCLWIPLIAITVLFPQIVDDLHLSVAQAGLIWGIAPAAGILFAILGGLLADKIGIRFSIGGFALLGGIFGALRGISTGFISMLILMFLFGICFWVIQVNSPKVARLWFPPQRLGMANGIIAASGIVGGVIGSAISANIVLSAMGSWQNVLFLYGAISAVLGIVWLITAKEPVMAGEPPKVSVGESFLKIVRNKNIWFCALTMLGLMAGYQGLIGYLPLHLVGIGWDSATAGGALAALLGVGIVTIVLIPILSDKLGARKLFIIIPSYVFTIALILIGLLNKTTPLWIMIILAGLAWGPIIAILMTLLTEQKEVGPLYAGTALGIVGTLGCVGGFIGPTLGNASASINTAFPFIVFGILTALFVIAIFFARETGIKK